LFRQCLVRTSEPRSIRSCAAAAAIAAVPFSLWHIPQRLSLGLDGGDLALNLIAVWIGGIVAAYLYVRSRSLMLVMALHALFNDPAPLFASPLPPQVAPGVIVLLVIAMLELRARRRVAD
jgi:membrane protease YdiL (CAAX protease family)